MSGEVFPRQPTRLLEHSFPARRPSQPLYIARSLVTVCPDRDRVPNVCRAAVPAYAVDGWTVSALPRRFDHRSFLAILTCPLSRALPRLCFDRIPTSRGAPPNRFRQGPHQRDRVTSSIVNLRLGQRASISEPIRI